MAVHLYGLFSYISKTLLDSDSRFFPIFSLSLSLPLPPSLSGCEQWLQGKLHLNLLSTSFKWLSFVFCFLCYNGSHWYQKGKHLFSLFVTLLSMLLATKCVADFPTTSNSHFSADTNWVSYIPTILTLSTWSYPQIPQVKGSVSQDWNVTSDVNHKSSLSPVLLTDWL